MKNQQNIKKVDYFDLYLGDYSGTLLEIVSLMCGIFVTYVANDCTRVAMSLCLSGCLFVCLSVCAIQENPLPEVVENFV